jgi:hypothetical protein
VARGRQLSLEGLVTALYACDELIGEAAFEDAEDGRRLDGLHRLRGDLARDLDDAVFGVATEPR